MKIAFLTEKIEPKAEAEIKLLEDNGFEVLVFDSKNLEGRLINQRKDLDLIYVWQAIGLAGLAAKIKFILQTALVYRQNEKISFNQDQKKAAKYLFAEADKILLADNDFVSDWQAMNLDLYEQKLVLPSADEKIAGLFEDLIKANKNYDLRICYFGSFDQYYTRNRILLKGLPRNQVKVIKVNDRSAKLAKFFKLWRMHRKIKNDYDLMFVAFQGQLIMPLAWLLARLNKKKIVFDAIFSIYDSVVLDRKEVSPRTFRAKYLHFLDWLACRLADIVIVHTKFHKEFFIEEFGLKNRADKIVTLYVGADNELLFPRPELAPKADPFVVHFHGSYIPAQGLEHVIIGAAKILKEENIVFNLIGRGQSYQEVKNKAAEWQLNKVNFIKPVPYRVLGKYMNQSDVCLGSFGVSPKITRVVPLKVFEALACGRALITARTPAILELLTEGENCLLTEMGEPQDLAEKILYLKNNPAVKEKIAKNGYDLFVNNLSPNASANKLKKIFLSLYETNQR
ncbi:MAG: hypothetical protein A3J65_04595 [Candidatus Buchananbacteria bacterium RIFCSPHIGHO2_02_FULL_45_11b]|uniref:Glycosyl transferase family 1 domain-containing protein n=1 Tax=Candidatus Buchananbacteria bacterium RIFCSPHIGHO2_02_FULL_45_11b TaxID=1797541 RepID=A0A1G1YEW4_9BACT|nr:MAG: hypothetical protein A3J65_04595 [Candidatus Buchananbacteria bacterium RIFCSPHIGHO2_02_FULL_45_11b]